MQGAIRAGRTKSQLEQHNRPNQDKVPPLLANISAVRQVQPHQKLREHQSTGVPHELYLGDGEDFQNAEATHCARVLKRDSQLLGLRFRAVQALCWQDAIEPKRPQLHARQPIITATFTQLAQHLQKSEFS